MRQKIAIATLVFFSAIAAHAQAASVYITYSPVHLTNVPTGSQGQTVSYWAAGIGGGVTVNFLPLPVVSLGLDVRGSTRPGTDGTDTALAGIKLGLHAPILHFKPYIQASTGYIGTRTANESIPRGASPYTNHYLAYEILGGLDYPLGHFVDARLIEIGGGRVVNGGSNAPSVFTINTGIVFHF